MIKISVSILGAENKIEALKKLNKTDADYMHLDLMDGKFVPFKTPPFNEINKIIANTNKKLDIHLMTSNPSKYIKDYGMLNTEYITIHVEINEVKKYLNEIKEYGLKCGLAISPNTEVKEIIPYLDDIDLVLLMSVEPGLPGQTFNEKIIEKINQLKQIIKPNTIISVDGGINEENSEILRNNGIDMISSGTYVTNSEDYQKQIKRLRG